MLTRRGKVGSKPDSDDVFGWLINYIVKRVKIFIYAHKTGIVYENEGHYLGTNKMFEFSQVYV